jgi:hypothetical protein
MEQTKQQTALDLFIAALKEWKVEGSLTDYEFKIPAHIFNHMEKRARQMGKDQIEDAYWTGGQDPDSTEERCQQYYNEIYGAN